MGLFGKKPPCPFCGGKIGWMLPSKIDGEYVCDVCYGKIDMDEDMKKNLTMQKAQEYFAFYEENSLLRQKFVISQKVDFGLWDTKIIFDFENHLFCMSKRPDKTVFEGRQLKSFVIKEDHMPLIEGTANGIRRYESMIPEKAMALAPQLAQYAMNRRMVENMERLTRDDDDDHYRRMPTMDIPEPFKNFNVELHFDHPYWNVIYCDMSGPTFSDTYPDVEDYLRDYRRDVEELEILAEALKEVAFPNAGEQNAGMGRAGMMGVTGMSGMGTVPAGTVQPPTDAIEEIRKYKGLLEDGLISEEEFQAKKRQLLGI